MTLQERANSYARTFPKWPASHPWVGQEQGHDVIYGIWVIGNDYQNPTSFYGAYPKGYLFRVMSLFPDMGYGPEVKSTKSILHAFSGSVPYSPHYERCDLKQESEYQCSVYDLPSEIERQCEPRRTDSYFPRIYDLVLADPPYSAKDAKEYDTPGVDRRRALRSLAKVTVPGGYLVWLDTCWPMHSKEQWITVGRIFVQRSTNHRVRVCSIFERVK